MISESVSLDDSCTCIGSVLGAGGAVGVLGAGGVIAAGGDFVGVPGGDGDRGEYMPRSRRPRGGVVEFHVGAG